MRKPALFLFCTAFSVFGSSALVAADRVTATGKVLDADGRAVEHAAVLVYSAGVKVGVDRFCPTCYVDCGKRAFTGSDGSYTIIGLSSDLLFNLLVVREGYAPKFVNKIDPVKGTAETATLAKHAALPNPAQVIRGRVVDEHGTRIRDALVEQQGAIFEEGRSFGDGGWIDLMAVTNDRGEFVLAYRKPLQAAIVQVSARGMATRLATAPSGSGSTTITVSEGAIIRGRLLENDKPVANAEVGLTTHSHISGDYLREVRIGTDEDGKFVFTNVPTGRIWDVYGKMESLAPRGLTPPIIQCATKDNGQDVDVGDMLARPAYTLHGRIVLIDGNPIPPGMRVSVFADQVSDRQTLVLPPDGQFEFKGLGKGVYGLSPAVKGYEAVDPQRLELLIEGNQDSLTVPLQPRTSGNR